MTLVRIGVMFLVVSLGAFAAPFQNGSFELGTNPGGGFLTLGTGSTGMTGWVVSTGNVDYIGGYWTAADGSRSVDLNGTAVGSISQTFDTISGQMYDVHFALAGNPDGLPTLKTLTVSAGLDSSDYLFDATGRSGSDMGWINELFQFTATGASTTLTFASTTSGCCYGPAIDNVSVLASVPEPGTFLLAAPMLAGLLLLRRKRA